MSALINEIVDSIHKNQIEAKKDFKSGMDIPAGDWVRLGCGIAVICGGFGQMCEG
jgi:hypothetical protein